MNVSVQQRCYTTYMYNTSLFLNSLIRETMLFIYYTFKDIMRDLFEDELHLCLVLSKRTRARLERVDWSAARKCAGVVDCIDHNSVSGSNMWGVMTSDEEVFASEEVQLTLLNLHFHIEVYCTCTFSLFPSKRLKII